MRGQAPKGAQKKAGPDLRKVPPPAKTIQKKQPNQSIVAKPKAKVRKLIAQSGVKKKGAKLEDKVEKVVTKKVQKTKKASASSPVSAKPTTKVVRVRSKSPMKKCESDEIKAFPDVRSSPTQAATVTKTIGITPKLSTSATRPTSSPNRISPTKTSPITPKALTAGTKLNIVHAQTGASKLSVTSSKKSSCELKPSVSESSTTMDERKTTEPVEKMSFSKPATSPQKSSKPEAEPVDTVPKKSTTEPESQVNVPKLSTNACKPVVVKKPGMPKKDKAVPKSIKSQTKNMIFSTEKNHKNTTDNISHKNEDKPKSKNSTTDVKDVVSKIEPISKKRAPRAPNKKPPEEKKQKQKNNKLGEEKRCPDKSEILIETLVCSTNFKQDKSQTLSAIKSVQEEETCAIIATDKESDAVEILPKCEVKEVTKTKTEVCERVPKFFTSSRHSKSIDGDNKSVKCSFISSIDKSISGKKDDSFEQNKDNRTSSMLAETEAEIDVYTFTDFKADSPNSILKDYRNPLGRKVGKVRPIARVKGTVIDHFKDEEKNKQDNKTHKTIKKSIDCLKLDESRRTLDSPKDSKTGMSPMVAATETATPVKHKNKTVPKTTCQNKTKKLGVNSLKKSQIERRALLKRSRIKTKPKISLKRAQKVSSGSSQTEDDDEFENSTFALNVNVLGTNIKKTKDGTQSMAANEKAKSKVTEMSCSGSSSDDGGSESTSGDSSDNRKLKPPTAAKISRRSSDNLFDNSDEGSRRSKLLGFWNGPKKHRMASLNALAKVHCLYENESRTHMELGLMKTIDRTIKLKNVAPKKSIIQPPVTVVKTPENRGSISDSEYEKKTNIQIDNSSEDDAPEPSTRNLRVVPGSRGSGKYWDPKSSTSSSEEADSDAEMAKKVPERKKAVLKTPPKSGEVKTPVKAKKISGLAVKKRRKRNEVVMDLRDMVVQKRMASLNATAILAASYEKRSSKSSKEETTSDSSSDKDETYARKRHLRDNTSRGEEPGTSGTTAPKVEVIVNRESDVTITGVYAHHEGYCMSKMQYHYSSTSHTKTTATTSAEESAHDDCPGPRGPYTPLNALSSMRPPANPPEDPDGHNPPALTISCEGSPEHEHDRAAPLGSVCAPRAGPCSLGALGRRGGASAFSAPPPPAPPSHHRDAGAGSSGGGSSQGYYQPAGPLIKEGPRDSEGERRARDLARYHAPHAHYHTHHPPHHQQMIHYGAPPYAYGGDLCYSRFYRPQPAPNAYLPPGAPPDSQLVGMGGGDTYPPPPQFYGAPPCYQHGPRGLPYIEYSPCNCPMNTCSKNVLIGPAIGNPPTGGGPATNVNNGGAFGADEDPLAATVAVERPGAVPEPPGAPGPPSPARGSAGACTPQPPSAGPRRARLGKAAVRRSLAAADTVGAALVRPVATASLVLPAPPPEIKTERPDSAHDEQHVPHLEDTAPTPPISPTAQVAPPAPPPPASACLAPLQPVKRVVSPEPDLTLVSAPIDLTPKQTAAPETCLKRRRELSKPEVAEIAENAAPINGIGEHVKLQKRRKVESRQLTGTYKDLISPEAVKVVRLNNGKKHLNVPKESKPTAKAILKPPSGAVPVLAAAPPTGKPNKRKAVADCADEPLKKKKVENDAVDLSVFRPKNKSAQLLDKLLEKNAADREIERVIESVVRNYSSGSPPPGRAERTINNNVLEKAPSIKNISAKTVLKESTESKQIVSKSERVEPSASAVRGAARRASKGRGKAGPRRGRGASAATVTAEEAGEATAVTPRWSNGWTWEGEPSVAKVFLNNDESVSVMRRCWAGMVHSRAGDVVSRGDCVLLRASARRGNDEQPFVARVARLWENPSDGEMMVSLVWYYRPEHTERGPAPGDAPDEVFASRHRDANSVACIEDKCYVLTFNEYCRYRARLRAAEEGITRGPSIVPELPPEDVPLAALTNDSRLPRNIAPELVLFCRKVYDFRSKKIQIPNK